jgi:hypothetical protein
MWRNHWFSLARPHGHFAKKFFRATPDSNEIVTARNSELRGAVLHGPSPTDNGGDANRETLRRDSEMRRDLFCNETAHRRPRTVPGFVMTVDAIPFMF